MRRPSPAMAVALLALVIALAGSAVAATKLTSSGPIKVCVPSKANKPLLAPSGETCKKNYALAEVGKEGPPGKEGAPGTTVVARGRLSDFESPPDTAVSGIPLTAGTWTQGAEEENLFSVHMAVKVPGSECPNGKGHGILFIRVLVNGVEAADSEFRSSEAEGPRIAETQPLAPRDLFEPATPTERTLTAEVTNTYAQSSDCTFTIESVGADVLGVR